MRLATVRIGGGTRAARLEGESLAILEPSDVGELLAGDFPDSSSSEHLPLSQADWAPLVTRPPKIICLGHNYLAHIREVGAEIPSHPTLFAKYARALIGARDPIVLPRTSEKVDWEVELAFVIGRTARHAAIHEASEAIAGYTILNDVSMRDYQYRTPQWLQGKMFEKSTPVGPVLVSPDELRGAEDLVLRCEVDGKVMQEGRTSDLVFSPVEIVSYVSDIITLEPGDLISTGTPAGVGQGRKPPLYLKPGQTVRTTIEGIGELLNECVLED